MYAEIHNSHWLYFCERNILATQAFNNYNFLNTRFHASKTVLDQCLSMWEIVHVKEQMCMLLIITWSGNINCTKLVLKPFRAKNSLFQSCLLLLFCRLYYVSLFDEFSPFLYTTQSMSITAVPFFEKLKWEAV